MALSNLPPGVTDRMIDEQFGGDDDREYCDTCGELIEDCECPKPDDEDEDFISDKEHEEASYRSAMIDAGRGHLLR